MHVAVAPHCNTPPRKAVPSAQLWPARLTNDWLSGPRSSFACVPSHMSTLQLAHCPGAHAAQAELDTEVSTQEGAVGVRLDGALEAEFLRLQAEAGSKTAQVSPALSHTPSACPCPRVIHESCSWLAGPVLHSDGPQVKGCMPCWQQKHFSHMLPFTQARRQRDTTVRELAEETSALEHARASASDVAGRMERLQVAQH